MEVISTHTIGVMSQLSTVFAGSFVRKKLKRRCLAFSAIIAELLNFENDPRISCKELAELFTSSSELNFEGQTVTCGLFLEAKYFHSHIDTK